MFITPGPGTLSSVPLGQELCLQYPWAKNSVIRTPGPRTLSSVPLDQELCHQYPWAKNSVFSTPGPRTLSSVPLGQELSHQYPWAKNSVISTPGPRTLSSVPLGQELCHQYPWATGPSPTRLHWGPWQMSPEAMEATSDRRAGTQSRRGSPAKQSGPATQATRVRRSYRRLAGAIPLVVRDTSHSWAAPRAAAQRRGHVALPMDTCGDTLPPGTHGLAGGDNAFPSTCGSGSRGT